MSVLKSMGKARSGAADNRQGGQAQVLAFPDADFFALWCVCCWFWPASFALAMMMELE